jgi:hypothetical protein
MTLIRDPHWNSRNIRSLPVCLSIPPPSAPRSLALSDRFSGRPTRSSSLVCPADGSRRRRPPPPGSGRGRHQLSPFPFPLSPGAGRVHNPARSGCGTRVGKHRGERGRWAASPWSITRRWCGAGGSLSGPARRRQPSLSPDGTARGWATGWRRLLAPQPCRVRRPMSRRGQARVPEPRRHTSQSPLPGSSALPPRQRPLLTPEPLSVAKSAGGGLDPGPSICYHPTEPSEAPKTCAFISYQQALKRS